MTKTKYKPIPAAGDVWHDKDHKNIHVTSFRTSILPGVNNATLAFTRAELGFQTRYLSCKDFVDAFHPTTRVFLRAAKDGDLEALAVLTQIITERTFEEDPILSAMRRFLPEDEIKEDMEALAKLWVKHPDASLAALQVLDLPRLKETIERRRAAEEDPVNPRDNIYAAAAKQMAEDKDALNAESLKVARTGKIRDIQPGDFATFLISWLADGPKVTGVQIDKRRKEGVSASVFEAVSKTESMRDLVIHRNSVEAALRNMGLNPDGLLPKKERGPNRHQRRAEKVRAIMSETAYDGFGQLGHDKPNAAEVIAALQTLVRYSHGNAKRSGWWDKHFKEGQRLVNPAGTAPQGRQRPFSELVALSHSELSEALEYDRKGGNDDKLPEYDGRVVELMDALHRVFDTLGAINAPLETYWLKGEYNLQRQDHKLETRNAKGGKAY